MGFLLHHLLAESAARNPRAPAVRYKDDQLTYAELDERSERLAWALRAAGVGIGDRIVLHLPKSVDAVVALYGALKAGACYVPVDAGNPAPRLADIVEQCSARVVVTTAAAAPKLTPEHYADSSLDWVLFADETPDLPGVGAQTSTLAEAEASAAALTLPQPTDQDLAYVLFTSGSTGRPKGVMLSHLNALTFVNWGCETFGVTADDRLSNHAPFNFDLSIFDLFVAAKAGASVTLVPEGLGMFPIRLAELIEEQRITVWYSVPSVLRLLADHGALEKRDLPALRLVLFAGEVFPTKHLRKLMLAVPGPSYYNLYGPTETNVCTFYEVEPIPQEQTAPIPIGRPCANTDAFALDEHGRRVEEPGREGLLYVRGSSVMKGYYDRPEETAAAFAAQASGGQEERAYCTQDWVTLDDRGDFLFLGRKDHMVKVGGYRIELGEIEAALYAHAAVREAVAVALPDEQLGNRIQAFVVVGDAALDQQAVKQHCARLLPKYMVPHDIEFRVELPRTGTDKVDRTRLRDEALAATGA